MKPWTEVLGWYGAVAILLAYALNSFGVVQPEDLSYQLLNLTGAFGIVAVSVKKKTYQPALLNLVWLVIAAFALLRSLWKISV